MGSSFDEVAKVGLALQVENPFVLLVVQNSFVLLVLVHETFLVNVQRTYCHNKQLMQHLI
jgi:hypothetical protein